MVLDVGNSPDQLRLFGDLTEQPIAGSPHFPGLSPTAQAPDVGEDVRNHVHHLVDCLGTSECLCGQSDLPFQGV